MVGFGVCGATKWIWRFFGLGSFRDSDILGKDGDCILHYSATPFGSADEVFDNIIEPFSSLFGSFCRCLNCPIRNLNRVCCS